MSGRARRSEGKCDGRASISAQVEENGRGLKREVGKVVRATLQLEKIDK